MALVIFQHHPLEIPSRLGETLRDRGHRLRILRLYDGASVPDLDDVDAVVSMGGPMNVADTSEHGWIGDEMEFLKEAHDRRLPIVGVCLGAQLLAATLGGEVGAMEQAEAGWHAVQQGFPGTTDALHAGVPWRTMQMHLHSQEVKKLPPDATPLSGSEQCKTQAFRVGQTAYGFQYHFEWTRREIEATLEGMADDFKAAGADAAEVRRGLDEHYPMYRHLGDRLCDNIADLLMPLDKRATVPRRAEPVANYLPSRS